MKKNGRIDKLSGDVENALLLSEKNTPSITPPLLCCQINRTNFTVTINLLRETLVIREYTFELERLKVFPSFAVGC